MKRIPLQIILAAVLLTAVRSHAAPKNIILMIGDGMGTSQLTAAKYVKGELDMERCPVGGLVTTHSSDRLVTDSAASGTALATGYKTTNGTISQTPEGIPLKTALEAAEEHGKATGLVATSAITHATPASFAAHVPSRKMEPEIAEQMAAREIEVLFGGGLGFFLPKTDEGSLRKDDRNILNALPENMQIITTKDEFNALERPERVAGLFAHGALPRATEGRITLSAMTAKAIEILDQYDEGFFLMVEGSQIDWGGHANDADYVLTETIDFDDAVGAALDFAEKDGDTLVIVTADHETGGFALLNGSVEDQTLTKSLFATKGHTATMVPLFVYGPEAEEFGGMLDNTELGMLMNGKIDSDNPSLFRRLFGWLATPFG